MPRPPTRHGLEKKFKPWRKGKSTKNKSPGATGGSSKSSRASLKNTLRSQRRLLQKLPADGSSCDPATRAGIEATIAQLEAEIAAKQQTQKERRNAEKYHQVRFFDRQRLVRLERTVRRSLDEAAAAADAEEAARLRAELDGLVRDKLYVAFFPNDTKYFSLFRGGERVVDDAPTAEKRQMIRNRIAQEYHGGRLTSKSWFNLEEIKEMKSPLAAKSSAGSDPSAGKRKRAADASTKSTNKAVKKVASGKKEEDDRDGVVARNVKASNSSGGDDSSSSSSSSSSSGDDDSDSEQHESKVIAKPTEKDDVEELGNSDDSDSSSSSSSSSGSSDSDSSSSSDSDSSSSSSDDSEAEDEGSNKKANQPLKAEPQPKMPAASNEESDDDFFADDGDGGDVFEKAAQYSTGYEYEEAKGDKSRGWTTQKQRPGQWKKNRNKRY